MPVTVGVVELRERLHGVAGQSRGGGSRLVELPVSLSGSDEGFRPVFADGVLRAEWRDGDADALEFSGSAVTAFADVPVPVRVSFSHDDGRVNGVDLTVELPGRGVAGEALGKGLGMTVSALPGTVAVNRLVLRRVGETAVLTGRGALGTVTVVSQSETGRLLTAASGAWQAVCVDRRLTAEQVSELLGAVPGLDVAVPEGGIEEGSWLAMPGLAPDGGPLLVPVRPDRTEPEVDPKRRDGLGRALPVPGSGARTSAAIPRAGARRVPHAVAIKDGFVLVAPGWLSSRRRAGFVLGGITDRVSPFGFIDIGTLDGAAKTITFDKPPLRISGGLGVRSAAPPYTLAVGGVLLVDTGMLHGSAIAAAYAASPQMKPSFFAFGALTADKGIGPPAFQVRGIVGGMGWRSNLRLPDGAENVPEFPFIKALDDPGSIGAGPDGSADPLGVLDNLAGGSAPWITPAEGGDAPLWIALGVAFTVAECLDGRAVMALQTGEDLSLALLGTAGMSFPKEAGRRKFANVEIALEALLKPKVGELSLSAALTSNSFVLDPNCRLRGGVAFRTWFGASPNKGDFVVSVGGYHPNYEVPEHYPVVPRLGFDWDLAGSVSVSGSAYFALTPAAVMAGGGLDVRFHAGPVKAWLTAAVDALIQWKPFYFDVGMRVSVGVEASVKIVFVRVTIRVEVGVSLRIWGPPTGGEAKVHLWFISFTIGFGSKRDSGVGALSWSEFRPMLPPADTAVRVIPGAGLLSDRPQSADGTLSAHSDADAWQVSSAGFTFSSDSAVPVSELYLVRSGGSAVETGSKLRIRPMDESNRTSVQRVFVTWHDKDKDLEIDGWERSRSTASVPQALWGAGRGNTLPGRGDQTLANQLVGTALTSPAPDYGNDTGYIGENALAFDPIDPDGVQPLDADAEPVGPEPERRAGSISVIARTVAATAQNTARADLTKALTGLGLDLGQLDADLSAHADAADTAFTAEPLLVPA
ncbi:DUF6603 domain-containing protein [Streptomyces noursei]|uniref:DUF6603 domain-containing protein n=1 Tax=Streptomyces noursei TaxID=1971 RepID=UPI000AD7F5D7|nr:DUF6603 domain-containing protein [Streptomyces noursei]